MSFLTHGRSLASALPLSLSGILTAALVGGCSSGDVPRDTVAGDGVAGATSNAEAGAAGSLAAGEGNGAGGASDAVAGAQSAGATAMGEAGGDGAEAPAGQGNLDNGATTTGSGTSDDRWQKADLTRNGQNYFLMANGWGPGFVSQSISWSGTSFTVESMEGTQGDGFEPASYPTVFCGAYSDSRSQECGLPAALDSLTSLRTGWKWAPNGNEGEYNAAYDIWLSNGGAGRTGYLMVWLRDPIGQQPAGSVLERAVTVANVAGEWDIWTGEALGAPIINYVRPEGEDTYELEFDALDFFRDAVARGIEVPGTQVQSVAVGFEIWNGPITNLESIDFYVEPL